MDKGCQVWGTAKSRESASRERSFSAPFFHNQNVNTPEVVIV